MFSKVRITAMLVPLVLGACAQADNEAETVSDSAAPAAATPAPATTAPAASRDVCAMISADELKSTTTIESAGQPSTSGGADVCTWYGSNGVNAIVQVFPYASSYEQSREAFEELYEKKAEDIGGDMPVQYLNRLSDALFVWGRWAALKDGKDEPLWDSRST
jgi:hypothetical protein